MDQGETEEDDEDDYDYVSDSASEPADGRQS